MAHSTASTASSKSLSLESQSWSGKAHVLLAEGRYEAAFRCFCKAAEETPLADDYVSQAVCLIHLNRPKDALRASDHALSLASGHTKAWLFRGVALHRLGRFREAYSCYDIAIGQLPRRRSVALLKLLRGWLTPLKSSIKDVFKGRLFHLRLH